ncbi:AAA family ATPase [Corynebacterium camporealensis]
MIDSNRQHAQEFLSGFVPLLIRALVALLIVALLAVVATYVWRKYRFRHNPLAGEIDRRRDDISEQFGLTIKEISPGGRISIQPGESQAWKREGLEEEMQNYLGRRLRLLVKNGAAWIKTPFELPEMIKGNPEFTGGHVYIGVDLEEGLTTPIDIRNVSTILVGGRPGTGKTWLIENLYEALSKRAEVFSYDGKTQEPESAMKTLLMMQDAMKERLENGVDWWARRNADDLPLLVFFVDECQRLFSADSADKEEKKRVVERTRVVRDIAQRGRAAGVILVLGTQRLSADVIPTSIRDLAGVRFVGWCTRQEEVEMILGRRTQLEEPDPTKFRRGQFLVESASGEVTAIQSLAR